MSDRARDWIAWSFVFLCFVHSAAVTLVPAVQVPD